MRSLICLIALAFFTAAPASERYVLYYYPQITSEEVSARAIIDVPPPNKEVRVRFISMLTQAQLDAPETPRFVVFAKGAESDTLIMTALDDEVFKTIYRARPDGADLGRDAGDGILPQPQPRCRGDLLRHASNHGI